MRFVFAKEKGGQKTYYSNVWDSARRRKIKKCLGTNLREAEALAEKLHAQIAARNLGIRPKVDAPKLDDFIPGFISENYAGKVTLVESERALLRFREFAGNIPLTAVSKGLMNNFISLRRKDLVPAPFRGKSKFSPNAKTWKPKNLIKNGTINRDIDIIKRMLSFALERDIINWNPLAGLKKLSTKDSKRTPMLSTEQIQHLLNEAQRAKTWRFAPAIVLAFYTGRRKSDLFKRRVTDYKSVEGLLYLGKTKKGEDEWIQLGGAARTALDMLLDKAVGGWLFPNADGTGPLKDMDTAFREAKKRAGIDPTFRWHDLRHVAISYMIMAGVEFNTIASLVGHTSATMLETRYGHLSMRHKQATATIYGGFLDKITGLGVDHATALPATAERPISAQVADLISSEAARGIVVRKLLPGSPATTPLHATRE